MKTSGAQIAPDPPSTKGNFVPRSPWPCCLLVIGVGLVLVATTAPLFSRSAATPQDLPSSTIPGVKSVIGLANIKPGASGTLSLLPSGLEFSTGKTKADIAASSVHDVFTGQESRQDVSGMGGTLVEAAIPYGGGRVVSLFSHRVEVLRVEYVDSNGGFHGAIFLLSPGKATLFKNQLVARGAKASTHVAAPGPKDQNQ